MRVRTKGNIIVNDIQIGDIHYEFAYGMCIKVEVITKPKSDGDGYWTWKSKSLKTGRVITYGVREVMAHYGPNLYDYEAYVGCQHI